MRVLINMPSQYAGRPSGVAKVIFSLAEQWAKDSENSYLLLSPWTKDDLPPALQNSRLEIVTRPRPRIMIFDVLMQTFRMPSTCRKLGVDVVLNADPFGTRLGGAARVTIVHDLYFESLPEQVGGRAGLTMRLAYEWVLAGSARIVTVSDATRTDLARWRPNFGRKARTIHSDAIASDGVAPPDRLVQAPYVLLVGNATPNKNFAFAARALARLYTDHQDLTIVHVGHDPADTIAKALEQLDSPTLAVKRMTNVSEGDLRALYRDAACLVAPSLAEGFCLPILEAQDAGCPVVCPNVSAMPEIAGDAAIIYPVDDGEALAAAVARLLTEPDLHRTIVARGHENRARFSWARAANAYLSVFAEALSLARGR